MKTRLLSGGKCVYEKTIVPERLVGFQFSFKFTGRFNFSGGLYKNQTDNHFPAFELGLDKVKDKYSKDFGDFGGTLDTVLAKYKENSYKFGEKAGKLPEETRAAFGEMVDSLAPDAKVLKGLKSKYDEVFKGFEQLRLDVPAKLKSSYDNIVNQLDKFDYLKACIQQDSSNQVSL